MPVFKGSVIVLSPINFVNVSQARQVRQIVAHGVSHGLKGKSIYFSSPGRGDRVTSRDRLFLSPLPGLQGEPMLVINPMPYAMGHILSPLRGWHPISAPPRQKGAQSDENVTLRVS
jgi:hypothetical protein